MDQNHNENSGVHNKSFITALVGHCPRTGHSHIKDTPWMEQFKRREIPLWLPRTPLCVWMRCCHHLKSFTFNSHTTRTDLHCYGTFNTGNSESCLCDLIVYTLQVKTWGYCLLELLYNCGCISGPQSDYCDQNKCMTDLLRVEVVTHSS